MLIARSKIVEKIVRNGLGVEFKVVFLVYEEAGQIRGKIISATPVDSVTVEPILLEVAKKCDGTCFEILNEEPIASPYFSDLEIFLSHQKTRGPNK